jgi:fatty acid desaturase
MPDADHSPTPASRALDHRAVLAGLPAERRAALTERSDRAGLLHLAGHLGAIALLALPVALGLPFWPLFLLPLGVAQVFLFTLSHECTHRTPFRTPWINDAVGHAVGLPLLLPFAWFRAFHLAHHRHTNDPKRDPELEDGPRPATPAALAWHVTGLPYWWGMAARIVSNARGRLDAPYLPERRKPAMIREARVLLVLYALIAATLLVSPLALWLWIVPAALGQPFLRVYLLAEHGRCPPVADMLENSRTTFASRLTRALAWNMPFHAEHHSYPEVPFHRLPDLHRDLAPHLRTTAPGYPAFARDYAAALVHRGR